MGRRRIEMKKIEDKSSRQVTFSKRRSGLIKKATELSVLCDVQVALLVFSSRGRLYRFCSTGPSRLSQVLERYQDCSASKTSNIINEVEMQNLHSDCIDVGTCAELLKTVERCLDGNEQLSLDDFMQLEKQLDAALTQSRTRKNQLMQESVMTLLEQERMLREENEQLKEEVAVLIGNDKKGNHLNLGMNNPEAVDSGHPRPRETLPLLL